MKTIEPIIYLLSFMVVWFTLSLFAAEWLFKSDGQFFQVVATAFGGVIGALLTRINPRAHHDDVEPDTQAGQPVNNPIHPE